MRLFKNQVALHLPKALFLLSSTNEERTHTSIAELGYNLSMEVLTYLKDQKTHKIDRISFVGHSLGGLIVRSALPYLVKYQEKMHGYLSLTSPHLGYMYNTNSIISTGMWFLKRYHKSDSLK